MMKTFSIGGIHPNDNKISKDCKIEVLPVPSKVFISVAQHLGAPATPVVKVGDQVKVKIIGIDTNKHRISLSIKQAKGN